MKKLLVIIPDIISSILEKGEYQPEYYNPGNEFEEVHLLLVNADRPDPMQLQHTVGSARVFVHNLPEPCALHEQPWDEDAQRLLKEWASPAVELARLIRPQIIRCHGGELNVYVASRIRQVLGVPYVVSLHINPDVNATRRFLGADLTEGQRKTNRLFDFIEHEGLTNADLVLPVYRPILPYLERMGVKRIEVCYNVLNNQALQRKSDYVLHNPIRIISVGRQFAEKNPDNLLRAVAQMPGVEITLVGTGAAHEGLKALAIDLGLDERARFLPAVPNAELCQMLVEHDIFAIHSDYWELNKSVLEAMLTGLPLVMNRSHKGVAPELLEMAEQGLIKLIDNTPEAYHDALTDLIEDNAQRDRIGRAIADHAAERYAPDKAAQKYVEIYQRLAAEITSGPVYPIRLPRADSELFTLDSAHTAILTKAHRPLVLLPAYQPSAKRRGRLGTIVQKTAIGRAWLDRRDFLGDFYANPRDEAYMIALVCQYLSELGVANTPDILADRSYEHLLTACRGLFGEVRFADQPLGQGHSLFFDTDAVLLALSDALGFGNDRLLDRLLDGGIPTIVVTGRRRVFALTTKAARGLARHRRLAHGRWGEWAMSVIIWPVATAFTIRDLFRTRTPS